MLPKPTTTTTMTSDEHNPQPRGKNLADADEIFPEQRRGRRAGRRQLEPRRVGPFASFARACQLPARTAAMRVASFCDASTEASSKATSEKMTHR